MWCIKLNPHSAHLKERISEHKSHIRTNKLNQHIYKRTLQSQRVCMYVEDLKVTSLEKS